MITPSPQKISISPLRVYFSENCNAEANYLLMLLTASNILGKAKDINEKDYPIRKSDYWG